MQGPSPRRFIFWLLLTTSIISLRLIAMCVFSIQAQRMMSVISCFGKYYYNNSTFYFQGRQ